MGETQFDVQIQEYSATAAMINDLQARIGSKVYDASTPEGMLEATKADKEVRSVIIGLEKIRKKIKAPALKRCKDIDGEAKVITAQLEAIQDAPLSAIKAEEERQAAIAAEAARVEAERVAKLRSIIDRMAAFPGKLATLDSSMVKHTIKTVELIDINAEFGEFRDEAIATKGRVLTELATMLDQKVQAEKDAADLKAAREAQAAAERAAAEERRAAQAAQAAAEAKAAEELRAAREEQERAAKEAQDALDAKDAELAQLRAEKEAQDKEVGEAVAQSFAEKEMEIVDEPAAEEPLYSESVVMSVNAVNRPVNLLRALVELMDSGGWHNECGDGVREYAAFWEAVDFLKEIDHD